MAETGAASTGDDTMNMVLNGPSKPSQGSAVEEHKKTVDREIFLSECLKRKDFLTNSIVCPHVFRASK